MALSALTCRFQPKTCEAKRTFWPLRPMASAKLSSATATSMLWLSSLITIRSTSAGSMALVTYWARFSSHSTTSMRSPESSLDTAMTRAPRIPMQAPRGSMRLSLERTAILAREPGSRATPMISMTSWPISGTSMRKSSAKNSGAVREHTSCGPLPSGLMSIKSTRMRSPRPKDSCGII